MFNTDPKQFENPAPTAAAAVELSATERRPDITPEQYAAHMSALQYPEQDHAEMVHRVGITGDQAAQKLAEMTPSAARLFFMTQTFQEQAVQFASLVTIQSLDPGSPAIDTEHFIQSLGQLEFFLQAIRSDLGITRERSLIANLHNIEAGQHARYTTPHDQTPPPGKELPRAGEEPGAEPEEKV